MSSTCYPSNLTNAEWHFIEPLLPAAKHTGRPREWSLRLIVDGIFYLVRSGCAWRMLPLEYPPWPTVHDYYRRWRKDGTWESIHRQIRQQVRQAVGREPTPSGAVLDSQSIKTTEPGTLWVEGLLASIRLALMLTRGSRGANAIFS
jgi:putative transposase